MRYSFFLLFLLGCSLSLFAQLPKSNVYLFQLDQKNDTLFELSKPQYLSNYNYKGYNNQPAFVNVNEVYMTVQLPGENQTDIFGFNLRERSKTQITSTREGEFSPQLMPDRYNFSCIRQEFSGVDTIQRLWQFPIDRLSPGKPVFKYVKNIGYYHWINSYQVALFLVDDPNYLVLGDTRTDDTEAIASNIGRCFQILEGRFLVFLQKSAYREWALFEYNLFNGSSKKIIDVIPNSEDFVVLPDGTIIMGSGTKLFKFKKGDTDWKEIADLRFYKIHNITRLAISYDNKLAIVAD